ncbi:hypothetical protein [Mycolicibacterium phocaicum]|uniref:hypothetical protein n=1 Tax=Mycolicibacterium phocaicum TaxID=319706 RepID=UPI001CF9D771|nr:hypothetical protein [Mycolicibacterium phocaicum]UCZ58681.1 hypothetical protein LHJ73_18065 [Mycolicibacterium phocaicum]
MNTPYPRTQPNIIGNFTHASDLRALLRDNITDIVAVFDDHDPGIYSDDVYRCPDTCGGFVGTKAEWEQHLADKLADLLEQS